MAISLNSNAGSGAADPAKARVEIDFGTMGTDLPIGNSNRTIEFWAHVLTTSWFANTNTMFFYGTNNRLADGFGLDFGSNMGNIGTIDPFTNAIFDNDNQPTGVNVTTDQWVHFAMTWDGTAVRAFVNGIEKATMTSSVAQKTLMTGRTVFTIGGYPGENAYFNGDYDEFRIWTVARTATEIQSTMHKTLTGNEPNLTNYLKFDEGTGTTVADSVMSAGHTAHPGTLKADTVAHNPAWIKSTAPIDCQ